MSGSFKSVLRALLFFAVCLACISSAPVFAQQANADAIKLPGQALRVGTKAAPPFVIAGSNPDRFEGISIALWEAVARRLDLEFRYVLSDLEALLSGLEDDRLDVSVAALTVTAERETRLDFSYPFYSTGLAIAVPAKGGALWATLGRFFSWPFFTTLAGLALLLLGVGVAIWTFERRANAEEFGGSAVQGLGSGFWWAAVTMTTVGYGDKSPRTLGGRLVGLVWMFTAVIIISSFTAAIATSLTVDRLSSGIEGVEDLGKAQVVTVAGSAAAAALSHRGIAYTTYKTLEDALELLGDDRAEAVVYDAPLLNYRVLNDYGSRLQVLSPVFDRQDYAFALPQGSALREPINRAILEVLTTEEWRRTLTRYLGPQP